MTRSIDYGSLMHRAFRGLIDDVLTEVAEKGLPGAHHFFITFDTRHPDAKLADWLRERYPEEMTIVLQHRFEGLKTDPQGFAVTLSFGETPEDLYVPYDSIRTFVDPSVEFGLRFESHTPEAEPPEEEPAAGEDAAERHRNAEIVSLDSWRK